MQAAAEVEEGDDPSSTTTTNVDEVHVIMYTVQFMQHTASKLFAAWFNIHPLKSFV